MGVKVTGQFEPAGDFSIVDGADVSGNITGSNISSSGELEASSLGVNRTVSGRGDVEIAGDYHNFPSGYGQLAILSNISASNASGSDQGGQLVFAPKFKVLPSKVKLDSALPLVEFTEVKTLLFELFATV